MAYRRLAVIVTALLLASALSLQASPPKGKPIKPLKQWNGSVDDLSLMKAAPEVILSAKELEDLWQVWKVPGPVPHVDFAKRLVLVLTTRGSILRFAATLDDKRNLQVGGLATRDLRPGFRYVIAVVSRGGIKTINGKELAEAVLPSIPKASEPGIFCVNAGAKAEPYPSLKRRRTS
jgi:hypothetical protein